jgi:hypothetical protein
MRRFGKKGDDSEKTLKKVGIRWMTDGVAVNESRVARFFLAQYTKNGEN